MREFKPIKSVKLFKPIKTVRLTLNVDVLNCLNRLNGGNTLMPTDETRRVLKVFGVAVTAFEDAVDKAAPPEELKKADAEAKLRLEEVTALIDRLRARKK